MKSPLLLAAIIAFSSCKKEQQPPKGDWVIFSLAGVDVPSNYFLLSETELKKGSYAGQNPKNRWPKFEDEPLDSSKFNLARPLFDLPTELTTLPDSSFGCPGCKDVPYFSIDWHNGETFRHWSFERPAIPAYLNSYFAQMDSVLAHL